MEIYMTEPINAFELQIAIDKVKLYESVDNDIIQADLVHSECQTLCSDSQYINKQMHLIK
jgi:hypothetical protein